jgi:hypothetical protein
VTRSGWRIEGHAIVSTNDCIADAAGSFPDILRNDADWALFQAALDAAAIVALGRPSHLATPNPKNRNRLVLTSTVGDLEKRPDAWWWNPSATPLTEALSSAAPDGGIVAVPGGHLVFDYFLDAGFDAFHLSRATRVTLPGGTPVFSAIATRGSAEAVLAAHNLAAGETTIIDPAGGVTRTSWVRLTA